VVRVRGTCRICGDNRMLDPHHIISQGHAKKTGQDELISNPGNVVHICRDCHDQTTASMVKKRLDKKELSFEAGTLTVGALEARDKKAKGLANPKLKGVTCGRCGITGHNRTTCNRYTTVDGVNITTKTWKYRPKAKAKKKVKAKRKTKSKAKAKAKAKKKRKKDFIEAATNYRDPFKPGPDPFRQGKDPFR
jgi:hypothetical protein